MTLVASDQLVDDAEAVIETVADRSLANDWRERIDEWRSQSTSRRAISQR